MYWLMISQSERGLESDLNGRGTARLYPFQSKSKTEVDEDREIMSSNLPMLFTYDKGFEACRCKVNLIKLFFIVDRNGNLPQDFGLAQ